MLRETRQSVADMARALHITENGVRAQLNVLEEEGLVRQAGVFPGTRKPFNAYELTAEGENLFPKAYGQIICEMLSALSERMSDAELEELFDAVGKQMADKGIPGTKLSFEQRIALALRILSDMGGAANATERNGVIVLAGRNCPLSEAVKTEPRSCRIVRSFLSKVTGRTVIEKCEKSPRPKCCFEIAKA